MPRFLSDRAKTGTSRRAFLFAPFALGGLWFLTRSPSHALPDPETNGTGAAIQLMLVDRAGHLLGEHTLRKIVKSDAQWRAELTQAVYAVARRGATEFAFTNRFWSDHRTGVYRCVCCGTALFWSRDKFDSGTGWPSFTAPLSAANIANRQDRSMAETRTEVLCCKCDAHLGHVFDDGPAPAGLRYCMNSAALSFAESPDPS